MQKNKMDIENFMADFIPNLPDKTADKEQEWAEIVCQST
jgi:hypothetical protein